MLGYDLLLFNCKHPFRKIIISSSTSNTYLSTNVLMTANVSRTNRSMVALVTMKWWLHDLPRPKWLGLAKRTSSWGPKLSIVRGRLFVSGVCLLGWPTLPSWSLLTPSSSATDELFFLSLHKHMPIISTILDPFSWQSWLGTNCSLMKSKDYSKPKS